jgi:enoyl-CoA hydratase/3-hydroxyacyl-CoA dehydrogenase
MVRKLEEREREREREARPRVSGEERGGESSPSSSLPLQLPRSANREQSTRRPIRLLVRARAPARQAANSLLLSPPPLPDAAATATSRRSPADPPPRTKTSVLRALFTHLQSAHADPRVSAVVVTGSGKNFSAGFDIAQFAKSNSGGASAGAGGGIDDSINAAICAVLENGPKPTVAAIQGVALGGGLEVAMGCNARIAVKGAKMGLPELQLGIIPGFGGTQRLPRLVGLPKAIEMMLTSKPLNADSGLKLGLVDELVDSPDQLLPAARLYALAISSGKKARVLSLRRADKLPPFGEAVATVEFARAEARKRAPHLQHPQFCLDAILAGIAEGGDVGLKAEGEAFARSAALDTHRALVHVFFASRATKKIKGIEGAKPRAIKSVAVIGGGLMGSGIATALVLNGVQVALKEVNQTFLDGGVGRVKSNLSSRVAKKRMTQAQADLALSRLTGCLDYSHPAFKSADMVIEAVIEDVPLKQRIFADVEKVVSKDCTLATNTSTIDLDLVGAKLSSVQAKSRVVGAHFFSPAHVMPLLEIVRAKDTSAQAVVDTLAMGSVIKKTPVVVGNCTGFAVNRVFFPYTMAAMLLADCGLNPYVVDKVIAGFGMPMGPFRLNDLVGSGELLVVFIRWRCRAFGGRAPAARASFFSLFFSPDFFAHLSKNPPKPTKTNTDIGLHVGKNFVESFPERVYVSQLIPSMNAAKRLGEKTKAGFYSYDDRRRAKPDPAIVPLLQDSIKSSMVLEKVFGGKVPKMSPEQIVELIFFPVVNEGCRVIAEGIVDKPADLDIATVFAMGFPPYRGGLIFWADLVGAQKICERLEELAAQFAPVGADGFFAPCEYLRNAARSGRKLSAGPVQAARL